VNEPCTNDDWKTMGISVSMYLCMNHCTMALYVHNSSLVPTQTLPHVCKLKIRKLWEYWEICRVRDMTIREKCNYMSVNKTSTTNFVSVCTMYLAESAQISMFKDSRIAPAAS